jgi:hypothetical protein
MMFLGKVGSDYETRISNFINMILIINPQLQHLRLGREMDITLYKISC